MASMTLVALVFGFIMGTGTMAQDEKYCELSKKHTMCLYKDGVYGPACDGKSAALIPMTDENRTNIVNVHNSLRSKVALGNEAQGNKGPQPKAANMLALVWDTELEEIAKRWALQCTYDHDEEIKTSRFPSVGQNAGSASGYVPTWEDQVKDWYSEVSRVTSSQVSSFSDPDPKENPIVHYTQVVWATTQYVGCAGVKLSEPSVTAYLFCNYGVGGNYPGRPVYIEGKTGSQCPGDSPADSITGLCIPSAVIPTTTEATPVDSK